MFIPGKAKQADDAIAAADIVHGTFLSQHYNHRVYFLPQEWGNYSFGGLAWYNCRSGDHCKTWVRVSNKGTVLHCTALFCMTDSLLLLTAQPYYGTNDH